MATKVEVFKLLDGICPAETILATNTSSLSITEVAAATNRPDKVIGMHFFNPVPAMKLVELIKGQLTSAEVHDKIFALVQEVGKVPVTVNEAPGFVVNRILIPLVNEGIGILADGIATKEEIDTAMKLGANHPMGILYCGKWCVPTCWGARPASASTITGNKRERGNLPRFFIAKEISLPLNHSTGDFAL